jgi:galactonate dehydratase
MPHNPLGPVSTAACVHLGAAAPNFAWLEERSPEPGFDFSSEVFPMQPKLEGTRRPVPDGPGLGIEVNEELIREETFKFWESPHLSRRDGSHTNW